MIRNEVMHKQEIGKVFIYTPICASTNTMAQHWASHILNISNKAQTHGWVFAARHQVAGRGQASNSWLHAAGKDAAFSVILKPNAIVATDQFYLNMAVCLSVVEALKPYIPIALCIKWPNDIYVGDKKLGGILIENTLSGDNMASSIVGIGLNILSIIDPLVLPKAVSLAMLTPKTFTVIEIIHKVLFQLNKWYAHFSAQNFGILKEAYLNVLYKKGEQHGFTQNGQKFKAIVVGVTHPGKLLLELENGTTMTYDFKEVIWD